MVNSAGELLFFRHREGPWMPTLRLLHKCKNTYIYRYTVNVSQNGTYTGNGTVAGFTRTGKHESSAVF